MKSLSKSDEILDRNQRSIPGGISSTNRHTSPNIAFVKGQGSRIWDADGNEYIDYHAAFSPQVLGYQHPAVSAAVSRALAEGADLFGSGPSEREGRLAERICTNIPWADKAAFFNTGSEATAEAIRLARAAAARDHIIVMQGGYNGWHNDVACNLSTPLQQLGPRRSPGEYDFHPISAGIPEAHQGLVHPVNFNDLDSVRYVCERHPVAGLLTEPILQNVGLIKPLPGYLEGLHKLADEFGFLLIFDEVKTGFRHAFGGYAEVSGVHPDLAVYGKAIANGYPLAAIAGRSQWMDYFFHKDPTKRVLLAGTYNAHPVSTAAALATTDVLLEDNRAVYEHFESLGARTEEGLSESLARLGITATIVRQGSAFVIYFMDHAPIDWHDLAANHNHDFDERFRRALLEEGIFFFPLATKQCSISASHSEQDVDQTVRAAERALKAVLLSVVNTGA
jgi:glutamate-1-semialdehyde 2,1-aminomutase